MLRYIHDAAAVILIFIRRCRAADAAIIISRVAAQRVRARRYAMMARYASGAL